jgi:hypothetical protein
MATLGFLEQLNSVLREGLHREYKFFCASMFIMVGPLL